MGRAHEDEGFRRWPGPLRPRERGPRRADLGARRAKRRRRGGLKALARRPRAYLEAAQADLELLNRTVYPSLRAERDAIDLNLNDARAQKALREDHAKSKTAWLRDQAKSFPRRWRGRAPRTGRRSIAFNACARSCVSIGCRCHDDYDLFLYPCPVFFVPSCSLASGGLYLGGLLLHGRTAKPPIPPMTPSTRLARRCRAARMEEPSWLWRLGPRTRARCSGLGDRRAEPEQGRWRSPSRTRTSTSSSGGSTRSTSTATGARRATRIAKGRRSRSGIFWSCGRASGRRRWLSGW